jgi:hypothetical protein
VGESQVSATRLIVVPGEPWTHRPQRVPTAGTGVLWVVILSRCRAGLAMVLAVTPGRAAGQSAPSSTHRPA